MPRAQRYDAEGVVRDLDVTDDVLMIHFFADGTSSSPEVFEPKKLPLLPLVEGALKDATATRMSAAMDESLACSHLMARDVRKLVNSFSTPSEPAIIVRKHVVLFDVQPVRAVVFRDRCFVFVPAGSDNILDPLTKSVEHGTHGSMYFELNMLEALLKAALVELSGETAQLRKDAEYFMSRVKQLADAKSLEWMQGVKDYVGDLQSRLQAVHDMVSRVVCDDQDLAFMHLSVLHMHPERLMDPQSFDHDAAELMLEGFIDEVRALEKGASKVIKDIVATKRNFDLRVIERQRRILVVRTIFTVVSISITLATAIAAIFGQNLWSGIAYRHGWFEAFTAGNVFISLMVGFTLLVWLRHMGVFN